MSSSSDALQVLIGTAAVPPINIPLSITLDETTLANVLKAALGVATASAVGPSIVDPQSNLWSINAAGQIVLNAAIDTTTSNVAKIAYVMAGSMGSAPAGLYQVVKTGQCWMKTSATAQWVPVVPTLAGL